MTKYFGYKYLVNWPMIIEIYENPLGYFYYYTLHTVRSQTQTQALRNESFHRQAFAVYIGN